MEKRFDTIVGKEYGLFSLACPHFEQLQTLIGNVINGYLKDKSGEIKSLEIGCGDGVTSIIILQSNPNIHLTTIDNEKIMIKKTKNSLKKQKSNSYDIFASAFTLHNLEQDYRYNVLSEIHRVLKKGALFVNSDKYALDNKKEHLSSLHWQLKKFEKFSELGKDELKKEWTRHYLEDNQEDKIMFEGKSKEIMEQIGFENIEIIFREKMEATLMAVK